ncbi:MAG: DUF3592 domain-containing protein [Lacibacter sp.]
MEKTEKVIKQRLWLIISIYSILFIGVVIVTRTPNFFSGKITTGIVDTFETKIVYAPKSLPFESRPFPVISFKPDSNDREYYAYVDRNFYLRTFEVGDTVNVIYNPNSPSEASLFSFPYYWFGITELWAGLLVLAFILIILATRKVL